MWAEIVYGDKQGDIPETVSDSAPHLEESDILPDIPDFYLASPAVLEATRILQGRSIAHFIPDGRVMQ